MSELRSYPSIFTLGHRAIKDLLLDPVVVQEKVDGSQISFGVRGGELFARSKGSRLDLATTDKLFRAGLDSIIAVKHLLIEGWTYRGEVLSRPKHNTLAYERTPAGNIVLFDIDMGVDDFMSIPEAVVTNARALGLEPVPTFFDGVVRSTDELLGFLDRTSCLGGVKIEGFVIKNYARFGQDKRPLMGKYVSDAFKEEHRGDWRLRNPTRNDVVEGLIAQLRTDARWNKVIQHLRDDGKLEGSPRDIGPLIRELQADLMKENADEIREALFKWAFPKIAKGASAGFAEYYKTQLLESQPVATRESPDTEEPGQEQGPQATPPQGTAS